MSVNVALDCARYVRVEHIARVLKILIEECLAKPSTGIGEQPVFGGMILASFVGIFAIPPLYVMFQAMRERLGREHERRSDVVKLELPGIFVELH